MGERVIFIAVIFLTLLGSAAGCLGDRGAKKISLKDLEPIETMPAEEGEPLRIAVSAMVSPEETFVYYKEILDYVSEKLDMPVELVQRETYAEINDLVKMEELDAAFVCTGAYVDGHDEFEMELLVAPVAYGEPVYYSYIIVPAESDVKSIENLRGKTFAFTDPLSNTGCLVPTYMLAVMNETPDTFFERYIFTNSHDKSIEGVATNLVDGAAVDSLIWDYMDATDPKYTSKTKVIGKSPPYGIPPIVVPKGLDPELKGQLQEVFLHIHEDEGGREVLDKVKIDRFVVVDDSTYDSVREMKVWVEGHEGEK